MNTDPIKVTAAILSKEGKILIAQRNSSDTLANKWEFPGGKIEEGETAEACLQRELMEEFEIQVAVGAFVGSSIYHYDHISIDLLAYKASMDSGSIILKEHSAYKWVSLDQLPEYDFAPADIPFVEKLIRREIEL